MGAMGTVGNYDAGRRNVVGTIGFFALGLLVGGFAAMIAVLREYAQYKRNGRLECDDVLRYVLVGSAGAVVQLIILIVLLIVKM